MKKRDSYDERQNTYTCSIEQEEKYTKDTLKTTEINSLYDGPIYVQVGQSLPEGNDNIPSLFSNITLSKTDLPENKANYIKGITVTPVKSRTSGNIQKDGKLSWSAEKTRKGGYERKIIELQPITKVRDDKKDTGTTPTKNTTSAKKQKESSTKKLREVKVTESSESPVKRSSVHKYRRKNDEISNFEFLV